MAVIVLSFVFHVNLGSNLRAQRSLETGFLKSCSLHVQSDVCTMGSGGMM